MQAVAKACHSEAYRQQRQDGFSSLGSKSKSWLISKKKLTLQNGI
jgi:hypothetical protein